jgi:ferric-dicitrate binding protein FerR (iron transport regulator)
MKDRISDRSDTDLLQELFDRAQPRPRPPAAVERELRSRLEAEWGEILVQRRRRRLTIWGLAASSLLAALLIAYQFATGPAITEGSVIATVQRMQGNEFLWADGASGNLTPLGQKQVFNTGQRISIGSGSRIALAHRDGGSLRLDEQTTLAIISSDTFELTRGRLYFDSDDNSKQGHARFTIQTPFGEVEHRGTQFMVDVSRNTLSVSVREGQVTVRSQRDFNEVETGKHLVVGMDGRSIERPVSTFGGIWAWTEAVTPIVDLDRRSIDEFLQWVSRESGRRVVYDDAAAASVARQHRIHGNVALPPMQALATTLPTADLRYSTSGDTIRVMLMAD